MTLEVAPAKSQRRRKAVRAGLWLAAFLVVCIVILAVYFSSDSFQNSVRVKVVAELERATGGKVEIGSLKVALRRLEIEAHDVTIHGREGKGEAPLAHIDRLYVRARIVSFFSRKIALDQVTLDQLVLHWMVFPDGTTNLPGPSGPSAGTGTAPDKLFDLAIGNVAVHGGKLLLEQEQVPFELNSNELSASMVYSQSGKAYEGHLALSGLAAQYRGVDLRSLKIDDLHFFLHPDHIDLSEIKVTVEKSKMHAAGTLGNYNNPKITLQYEATADLRDVARAVHVEQLKAGVADVKGTLVYANKKWSSQGNLNARGVGWADPDIRLSGVEMDSPFSVAPGTLSLSRLVFHALGGSAQGELQITNWDRPDRPGRAPPQKGSLKLKLEGVQLNQLAAAISTRRFPADKIELAGRMRGDTTTSWTGPAQDALTRLVVDIDPPSAPSAREVPVTAQMQASYNGKSHTFDVAALNFATRNIRVNGTGVLGSETAQAHLSVNATDLRELQPALNALASGKKLPVVLDGKASFNGVVYGRLQALSARGRLELGKFETDLMSPARPSGAQPQFVQWDGLTGDVTYTSSMLAVQHGTLRRGAAQFTFTGSVGLRQNSFDERSSRLSLDAHIQNATLDDLQALAGPPRPITGTVNGDLQVSGTLHDLRGNGKLQVTKVTAYGEAFRSFRSDLNFAGQEVQLQNIELLHDGAKLNGSLSYNFDSRYFRFDMTGVGVELADFRRFEPVRLTMAGAASFHLTGSGTEEAPVINGRVDFNNLVLNQELVGNVSVSMETRGQEMVLHGTSQLENASLTMDGSVQMRGDFPGRIAVRFTHLDFDPLIRAYLKGKITGHSSMEGSIDIQGPMRRPRDLNITGAVEQLSADVENVQLQNAGPIHFAMENEAIRIDDFRLVGNETDMVGRATLQLSGDNGISLGLKGKSTLKLVQGLSPDLVGYGPAAFTVEVTGNWSHPQLSGRLELTNAGVSVTDLPNGLSQINGTLTFAQDRIQIEKLTAHTGGGELALGGFISLRNGLYFDLTASGHDIRLRWPPGVSASADAALRFTGTPKGSLLSGDIVVTRFGMNPRFDFANYLAESKRGPLGARNPFLENMRLDLHVTSTPELRVETSLAKLSGDLDLHIRGTAARPAVLGRVNIAEGDVFFNGTKYRLERGDITFSNPLTIEPVVNIEMSARVQDYDVTVGLHGQVTGGKGLSMNYRSDPPLSNPDIIALLAFGRPRGQDIYNAAQPGQTANDTANASNAILGQALNATFSDRVQRLFGASRVKIDPQFIGTSNNPSARVTIEQQISNNVTLTYITSLTQSAETVVQVEYNIDKNVSIVAVRDQNGVLGFDLHVRRRKR